MSQIDQAFVRAYAKRRNMAGSPLPAAPANQHVDSANSKLGTLTHADHELNSRINNLHQDASRTASQRAQVAEQAPIRYFASRAGTTTVRIDRPHANTKAAEKIEPFVDHPKDASTKFADQFLGLSDIEMLEANLAVHAQPLPDHGFQTTRKTLDRYFQESRAAGLVEQVAESYSDIKDEIAEATADKQMEQPVKKTIVTKWDSNNQRRSLADTSVEEREMSASAMSDHHGSYFSHVSLVLPNQDQQASPEVDTMSSFPNSGVWGTHFVERGIKSTGIHTNPSARTLRDETTGKSYRIDPAVEPDAPTMPSAAIAEVVSPVTAPSIQAPIQAPVQAPVQAPIAPSSIQVPIAPPPMLAPEPKKVMGPSAAVIDSLSKLSLPIQPAWEVDDFRWPAAIAGLLHEQADAFQDIGLHLNHAQSKGLRALAVTSGERGVGKSTVAMSLAKSISKTGLRVALVDCDAESPSLVDQLNLEVKHGWQDCIHANVPLDEVAVHATKEGITFFPLTESWSLSAMQSHRLRINKLLRRIASGFDLMIMDCNRLNNKLSCILGTGDEAVVDAALVIVDAQLSLKQRVDTAIEMLKSQEIQSIGLAENFHA